jgi:glycosyltransferase involved in cell wall biosynthesis
VLHNSLPYSSGGYGTRSHGVASGIRDAGYEVIVLTRPGFPLDIKPELTSADVAAEDLIDCIRYVRTLEPMRKGLSMLRYVTEAADALELRLREMRPEMVVAASNHVTALPALIAARRLGLPFVYEVRGLWEITRISREQEFEDTAAFAVQSLLEASVAQLADHVFTLTEPMREELSRRGVASEKIDLLPNSCSPERFLPRERDSELAARLAIPAGTPVIGYIGTFVDYEGLEDLTLACALLKKRGVEFRLMLVGNENASGSERGPITAQILQIATTEEMADWLIMPGRVPHEEVEDYYSLIDIAPFPRKPWPVCEMVSPLKPLEALAMQKAVVVSNVRALAEMIDDGKTGRLFQKGNVAALADTLEALIADPDLRIQLGRNGRRWVEAERTWRQVGNTFAHNVERIRR